MRLLLPLVAFGLLVGSLSAQPLTPQRFAGTHPNPVAVGGTLDVRYTNGGRKLSQITVEAHDGADPSQTREIDIDIGPNGVGTAEFEVPLGWSSVVLTYPDSADLTVPVGDAPPANDAISARAPAAAAVAARRS